MPKAPTQEVQVLNFFETGPIDKVEAVFNIVCEKMRERLQGRSQSSSSLTRAGRRRRKTEETPTNSNEHAEPGA